MPRIRLTEEVPVSIPGFVDPVCPRCLGIEPGIPGGDPNDPHPGPFANELCIQCALVCAVDLVKERGPLTKHTTKIAEQLAPHAVAIRPMQPWPRSSMPDMPDGPSRLALGPRDFEGQGREAFWDQSPEERAVALSAMVEDAGLNCATKVDVRYLGVVSERKAFAKGWLAELDRVRPYSKSVRKE